MKKIVLTVMMALAMMSANASAVNTAEKAAERINNIVISNDSVRYKMLLNDKMRNMRRSFHIDETQEEYLRNVQKSVEDGFAHMNEIKDAKTRDAYFNNLLWYWHRESRNAFANTAKIDWRKDYRMYWTCVNQTLLNMNYINENKK